MFDQTFVDGSGKTNKSWAVALSFVLESLAVGVLILVPLLWTEALPRAMRFSMLTAPAPPPPAPPPPHPVRTAVKKAAPRRFIGRALQAPSEIPAHAAIFTDERQPLEVSAGVVGFDAAVDLDGIGLGGPAVLPPPPPPVRAPPPPETPKRQEEPVRQSSGVQAARCIHCPKPPYPPIARQARIHGAVVLSAIIARDGTVKKLSVVSTANPLLTKAAMDAVAQWIYVPTILNREPVEVSTAITINFALQ